MADKKGSKKYSAYVQSYWDVVTDESRDMLVCSNGKRTCGYESRSHVMSFDDVPSSPSQLKVLFNLVDQYERAYTMLLDYRLNSLMIADSRVHGELLECVEHFDFSVFSFLTSLQPRQDFDMVVQSQQVLLNRASSLFDEYMGKVNASL